jgi:hypothetical protein
VLPLPQCCTLPAHEKKTLPLSLPLFRGRCHCNCRHRHRCHRRLRCSSCRHCRSLSPLPLPLPLAIAATLPLPITATNYFASPSAIAVAITLAVSHCCLCHCCQLQSPSPLAITIVVAVAVAVAIAVAHCRELLPWRGKNGVQTIEANNAYLILFCSDSGWCTDQSWMSDQASSSNGQHQRWAASGEQQAANGGSGWQQGGSRVEALSVNGRCCFVGLLGCLPLTDAVCDDVLDVVEGIAGETVIESEVQNEMIFMGHQILSCHVPVVRSFFIL